MRSAEECMKLEQRLDDLEQEVKDLKVGVNEAIARGEHHMGFLISHRERLDALEQRRKLAEHGEFDATAIPPGRVKVAPELVEMVEEAMDDAAVRLGEKFKVGDRVRIDPYHGTNSEFVSYGRITDCHSHFIDVEVTNGKMESGGYLPDSLTLLPPEPEKCPTCGGYGEVINRGTSGDCPTYHGKPTPQAVDEWGSAWKEGDGFGVNIKVNPADFNVPEGAKITGVKITLDGMTGELLYRKKAADE